MELGQDLYTPTVCSSCGNTLHYIGIGEYKCNKCGNIELDDYGKVRSYLEQNNGATAYEVGQHTGLSQRRIRQLVSEERIEVSKNSKVFLECKICGAQIRFGDICDSCKKKLEKESQTKRKNNISGFTVHKDGESGKKRYERRT